MIKAVRVEALQDFRIRVHFEDGVEGIVDLSKFAGKGVFRIWDEAGRFEAVKVGSNGEIEWSEQVAVCSDALYLEITGKSLGEVFPGAKEISLGA